MMHFSFLLAAAKLILLQSTTSLLRISLLNKAAEPSGNLHQLRPTNEEINNAFPKRPL
jgi:hypothetical protein